MAQCKISPQEFIKDSFNPQVGVLCSASAEEICSKNNLSFIELLQPFCKLNSELHYKDPNGTNVSLPHLKISLVDVNFKPPQPTLARKYLNSSVSDTTMPRQQTLKVGDYNLTIPSTAPWFEAWRETFLQVQYPADHEFTKHFIACMLVVSTSDPNPIDAMVELNQKLNQLQNTTLTKLPKWFNTNVLRYYVILHETIGTDSVRATEVYEAMKVSYGTTNTFLLRTNSQPANLSGEQLPDPWSQFINNRVSSFDKDDTSPQPSPNGSRVLLTQSYEMGQEISEDDGTTLTYHPLSPDNEDDVTIRDSQSTTEEEGNASKVQVLHGGCLSTEDVEQIKLLVHDFCTRTLMPYVEKQIHQISDFVANKKGVSKSLLSATKRWFTPNKPTSNSATINTLTYPADAAELQIRKLGDLYFMFGHYSMAFQAYHSAKRDFMADQAWLYYAGALEMAGLSAFMANETTRKTFEYLEESITTYLNTCKMAQFATRATLLSTECLKSEHKYGEAAHQLIRMTSEESDLRSALLLEQASYCFLNCIRPFMVRKYAFHMVLAGHRFNKAAQRKHSLRCYKQAYQIYESKGWNLAEDHIHYTIAKQANNLDEHEEAVQSYTKLLTGESKQSSQQQASFLKEYLTVHSALLKKQNNLLTQILPLPIVRSETIKVLVGPTAPLRTPGKVPALGVSLGNKDDPVFEKKWHKLEEMLVQEAQGQQTMIFKPMITLFTNENVTNSNPIAIIGEPIQVAVELYNPLQILLYLKDIYLLWQFKDSNNRFAVNEIMAYNLDHIMKTHYIKSIIIQATSTEEVILTITPLAVGEVVIKGICYSLISSSSSSSSNNTEDDIALRGKQVFDIKGPKVKRKETIDLKPDKRLEINIVPSAPCLQVSFCEFHSELLRNELQEISVELRNIGSVPLHKIYMATSMPHLLSSCEFKKDDVEFLDISTLETAALRDKEARKNHVSYLPLPNGCLEPSQFYNIMVWMKAPESIGPTMIDLLIYYENVDNKSNPRYRLVRHIWQLSIQESIKVDVTSKQSSNSKDIEELVLTVQATNLNKIHHAILTKISLLKAALLSSDWTLSPNIIAPENILLESQESVFLFLKMQRVAPKENNYSEVNFVSDCEQQSDNAYLDFAKRNDQNRVNIFDTAERTNKKHDALLILRWQAFITDSLERKRIVYGQNNVPIYTNCEDQKSTDDERQQDFSFTILSLEHKPECIIDTNFNLSGKEVTYNLFHPSIFEHNFDKNKICVVSAKLIIRSVINLPVGIKVQTLGTSSSSLPPAQGAPIVYPHSSKTFKWVNVGSSVRNVEPYSSISVNLSVAVFSPGTYDLGSRLEIWCHIINQPETAVLQTYRLQSSLIITNCIS